MRHHPDIRTMAIITITMNSGSILEKNMGISRQNCTFLPSFGDLSPCQDVALCRLVAQDGHGHAACATAGTGQLTARKGCDKLVVVLHVDLATDDVLGVEHGKACMVEGVDGVGVAAITDDLAIAQRESKNFYNCSGWWTLVSGLMTY